MAESNHAHRAKLTLVVLTLVVAPIFAQRGSPTTSCQEQLPALRNQLGNAQIAQGQLNILISQLENGTLMDETTAKQKFEEANPGKSLVAWKVVERPKGKQ